MSIEDFDKIEFRNPTDIERNAIKRKISFSRNIGIFLSFVLVCIVGLVFLYFFGIETIIYPFIFIFLPFFIYYFFIFELDCSDISVYDCKIDKVEKYPFYFNGSRVRVHDCRIPFWRHFFQRYSSDYFQRAFYNSIERIFLGDIQSGDTCLIVKFNYDCFIVYLKSSLLKYEK